jgi:hypothetical protein
MFVNTSKEDKMKRVIKILMVAMMISFALSAGWSNVFNGSIFSLAELNGDMRLATWDEVNDTRGTIKLDTLQEYLQDEFDDRYLSKVYEGFASLEDNTTGITIGDTDSLYIVPGVFSNYLKGFSLGSYGIRYNHSATDTGTFIVDVIAHGSHTTVNTDTEIGVMVCDSTLTDTTYYDLDQIRAFTAGEFYLNSYKEYIAIPPMYEVIIIAKASKTGTLLYQTVKTEIKQF